MVEELFGTSKSHKQPLQSTEFLGLGFAPGDKHHIKSRCRGLLARLPKAICHLWLFPRSING